MTEEDDLRERVKESIENIKKSIELFNLEDLTMMNVIISNKINKIVWDEIKDGER